MQQIQVRFFAAARAAAKSDLAWRESGTVAEILAQYSQENKELARILPQCSFLIDGTICHDHQTQVLPGSQLDVLPRFAGG